MKLYEIIFALACAALCAGSLWLASFLNNEPFLLTICAFTAAFWGSLAAFVAWSRISEAEEDVYYRPPRIHDLPNRRRAQ